MMKQNFFTLICLGSILLTSCNAIDSETPQKGTETKNIVAFTGSHGVAKTTKTTFTPNETNVEITWLNTDKIGIFWTADGANQNYSYTAVPDYDSALCSFVADDTANTVSWTDDVENFFYAMYPLQSSITAANDRSIRLESSQIQSAADNHDHIGNYAIMKAKPVAKAANDKSSVNFEFHNALSVIEFQIALDEGTKTVSSIRMNTDGAPLAFGLGTKLDLTQDIPSNYDVIPGLTIGASDKYPTSQSILLTLTDEATLSTAAHSFYMVVAPGTHTAGDVKLLLTATDGMTAEYTIPQAVTFKSNRYYKKAITIDDAQFNVAEIELVDCTTGFVGTVDMVMGVGQPMTDRTVVAGYAKDWFIYNIPTAFQYSETDPWKTLGISSGLVPEYKIKTLTAGKVFIMARGANNKATIGTFTDKGWSQATSATTAGSKNDVLTPLMTTPDETKGIFCAPADGSSQGQWQIFSKYFEANTVINVYTDYASVAKMTTDMRGMRPVAKRIVMPNAELSIDAAITGNVRTFAPGTAYASDDDEETITRTNAYLASGYEGLDFFAIPQSNTTKFTATVTKAGLIYVMCSAADVAAVVKGGWTQVSKFAVGTNTYFILSKWVAIGDEITTTQTLMAAQITR